MDVPTLLEWISTHAALLVFAWLTLENTLFLGFVAPGLTVLILAGLLIETGDVQPVPVLLAALAGTFLGDNLNYAIGRWGLRRFGWVRRILAENDEARRFIEQYPTVVYVFFHFPVYLRTAFPLTLGSMRYSYRTWLRIDLVAAPLFVFAFTGLGYGLAHYLLQAGDLVSAVREIVRTGNVILLLFSLAFAYGTIQFARLLWKTGRETPKPDADRARTPPSGTATEPSVSDEEASASG